ncbi:MAG: putative Ig domain-containing protein [Sulfuritalea sp.]|nr:putative Ig domain-containing protein [Sulfuritalea sp.]
MTPNLQSRITAVALAVTTAFAQAQPASFPASMPDGPGLHNHAARDPFNPQVNPSRTSISPQAALEALGVSSGLGHIRAEQSLDGLASGLRLATEARLGFSVNAFRLGLTDRADRFRVNGSIEHRRDAASFTGATQQPASKTWKLGMAGRVPTGVLSLESEADDRRGFRQNFFGYTAGLPSFAGGGRLHLLAGTRESRQLDFSHTDPAALSWTDSAGRSGTLNIGDIRSTRYGALWAPAILGGRTSLIATLDTVFNARVQGAGDSRADVYSRGGKALQMGVSRDFAGGNVYLGGMTGLSADGSVTSRRMNLGLAVAKGIDLGPAQLQRLELSVDQSGGMRFHDLPGGTYVEQGRAGRASFALGLGGTLGGGDTSLQLGNQGVFFGFAAQFDANNRIVRKAPGEGMALGGVRYRFLEGGTLPGLAAPGEQVRLDQLERQLSDTLARLKAVEDHVAEARARLDELQARGIQVASTDMQSARQALVMAQAEAGELVAQAETISGEISAATTATTTEGALGATAGLGGIGAGAAVAVAVAAGVAGAVKEKNSQPPAADTTPPVTSAGPSISGTTNTGATLSVTINEAGTGYYLVQAAAAAAPSVATLQGTGTAFALAANVAATPGISGLAASTAYKIYFIAKDAAGNVQAAVQSVAVTTSANDTIPDAFAFTNATGQTINAVIESNAITVAGINAAAAISIVGGDYQINGGAWTTAAGTVSNGQTVKLRHTASGAIGTTISTTLTIGGVAGSFSSTTSGNTAPTESDVLAQTLNEDGSIAVNVTLADTETAVGSLVFSASSSNAVLFPGGSIVLGGAGANRTITLTPAANTSGTATITYVTTDGGGLNVSKTFNVTVNAVQDAPVFLATQGNLSFTSGSAIAATTLSAATDADGDALTYSMGGLPAGLSFNPASRVISGTPTVTGTFNVTYSVTDGTTTVSQNFQIVLTAAEVPPVMGDVPNQTPVTGTPFSLALSGYVTTTNGDAVAGYSLASGSLPPGLGLNVTTGIISGTPTVAGTYNVTVLATDNDGNSNTDAITLTVSDGIAPVAPVLTGGYATTTAANSVPVEVNGEIGAAVWVNSVDTGSVVAGTAKVTINLDTSGADGAKNFAIVLKDAAGNASTATNVSITADRTAPSVVSMPVSGIGFTSATATFTVGESGTGHYLAQAGGAAPSVATVATTGTSVALTANSAQAVALSGLTAGTAYTVYFVAKDALGNLPAAVSSGTFTTLNNTAPGVVANIWQGTVVQNGLYSGNTFDISDAEGGNVLVAISTNHGGKITVTDSAGNILAATGNGTSSISATISTTAGVAKSIYYTYRAPADLNAQLAGGTLSETVSATVTDSGGLSSGAVVVGTETYQ